MLLGQLERLGDVGLGQTGQARSPHANLVEQRDLILAQQALHGGFRLGAEIADLPLFDFFRHAFERSEQIQPVAEPGAAESLDFVPLFVRQFQLVGGLVILCQAQDTHELFRPAGGGEGQDRRNGSRQAATGGNDLQDVVAQEFAARHEKLPKRDRDTNPKRWRG